jgi:hypothetical protein
MRFKDIHDLRVIGGSSVDVRLNFSQGVKNGSFPVAF